LEDLEDDPPALAAGAAQKIHEDVEHHDLPM